MNRTMICENCVCCSKPIRAGHPFINCNKCDSVLHKRCKTNENIVTFRDKAYCSNCIDNYDILRYNPFHQAPHFANNDLLDEEPHDYIESLGTVSKILENCQTFSVAQFNNYMMQIPPATRNNLFSSYFRNIDGNATNFDNLAVELARIEHKFSVIGLAETNTDPCNNQLYQLNNYTSCYQNRYFCEKREQSKIKGSGVCLYIHNSLNFSSMGKLSLCTENFESLFITITNMSEPIIVGVIYRPPNTPLSEFNMQYKNILKELNGQKAYILGDFNVNFLNLAGPDEDMLEELIFTHGFAPTVSIPTHKMPHCSKTCIDNIHTNDIHSSTLSGVIDDKNSHHRPIFCLKQLPTSINQEQTPKTPDKITIHYNYSNTNLETLCDEIENDIDTFLHGCDSFESFITLFQEKIDISCKLSSPKTTKRNSITNPWITNGLINSVEKKARLYFEWCKTKTLNNPEGDLGKHTTYKEYKKYLKMAVKGAKAKHYSDKFDKHRHNPKKTWQVINELRGKSKNQLKDDFIIDGNRVICRRTIANKFNSYFTSLANNLNEKVLSENNLSIQPIDSFTQFMSKSVNHSIYLEETCPGEILEIIHEFDNGKASDIPIAVVKKPAHLLSTTLAKLYNNCIQSGAFPSLFKVGKVTPIYKKDNKENVENYRPVSILPIFGKIFEKIIYKRLYTFFTAKGILHDEQFGFRKGHSTSHALHKSVDSITKSISSGQHVLGIFIDLSKAFDTLDHSILLKKLENYGVRGQALSLLKSYLTGRSQYVSFLNATSDTLSIQYGVPQGSILGPLLFLLYMNDIINCYDSSDCKFVLYADDTNIFVSGPSKESTYIKANIVLDFVSTFMQSNLLHINMSKCCYIHFQPASESDETCARVRPYANENDKSRAIFVNGHKILQVPSTKFLGVVIDEKLSWDPHIRYLRKKLRSITGAINRIKRSVPGEHYRMLYSALFESHLTYGISVWGSALKDQPNDKLFVTQKHCIRILFGDLDAYLDKHATCARARPYSSQKLGAVFFEKEHTKPIFNRLKLLTVQNLYKYYCISEIFKIIKLRTPYSLYSILELSKRDTSHAIILPSKTNTFLYIASNLWNTVHKQILNKSGDGLATSISLVKLRCKVIILRCQALNDSDHWTSHNFQIQSHSSIHSHQIPLSQSSKDLAIIDVI